MCVFVKLLVTKPSLNHLKNRPTILPASLLASPDPKAPFARLDAWENLSARLGKCQVYDPTKQVCKDVTENGRNYLKATVLVIVNINAIAVADNLVSLYSIPLKGASVTYRQ
jgi:hypothetical protein